MKHPIKAELDLIATADNIARLYGTKDQTDAILTRAYAAHFFTGTGPNPDLDAIHRSLAAGHSTLNQWLDLDNLSPHIVAWARMQVIDLRARTSHHQAVARLIAEFLAPFERLATTVARWWR